MYLAFWNRLSVWLAVHLFVCLNDGSKVKGCKGRAQQGTSLANQSCSQHCTIFAGRKGKLQPTTVGTKSPGKRQLDCGNPLPGGLIPTVVGCSFLLRVQVRQKDFMPLIFGISLQLLSSWLSDMLYASLLMCLTLTVRLGCWSVHLSVCLFVCLSAHLSLKACSSVL